MSRLFGVTDPIDQDDLIQDTLEAAVRRIDGYNPDVNFKSWLIMIMKNVAWKRKCSRKARMRNIGFEELTDGIAADNAILPTQYDAVAARQHLEMIPAGRDGEVLTMKGCGYNFTEIGERLGVTKQRAHQIYNRARDEMMEAA